MDRKEFLDQFQERRQKIVHLRDVDKLTWKKIALEMDDVSETAVMRAYNREKRDELQGM